MPDCSSYKKVCCFFVTRFRLHDFLLLQATLCENVLAASCCEGGAISEETLCNDGYQRKVFICPVRLSPVQCGEPSMDPETSCKLVSVPEHLILCNVLLDAANCTKVGPFPPFVSAASVSWIMGKTAVIFCTAEKSVVPLCGAQRLYSSHRTQSSN